MEFIKEWTICICSTLVVATVLSLLAPNSSNGKFYKTLVKIFIFLSFIYPFTQSSFELPQFEPIEPQKLKVSYEEKVANDMVRDKIIDLLKNSKISGAIVDVKSKINDKDEIDIKNIVVIVPDEYEVDYVKKLIFDNLSLNVEVIHIGQQNIG